MFNVQQKGTAQINRFILETLGSTYTINLPEMMEMYYWYTLHMVTFELRSIKPGQRVVDVSF